MTKAMMLTCRFIFFQNALWFFLGHNKTIASPDMLQGVTVYGEDYWVFVPEHYYSPSKASSQTAVLLRSER
jgi:hypothetical protein